MADIDLVGIFIESLPAGGTVIELGAGQGYAAKAIQAAGHDVIAIDKKPFDPTDNIQRITSSVEDWLPTLQPDFMATGYFLNNVLQFIDKDWVLQTLLPQLSKHLLDNGVIEIETFYKGPIPAFDVPHRNYYNLSDLLPLFPGWKIIFQEEIEHFGTDMQENERTFFLTRLVIQKP